MMEPCLLRFVHLKLRSRIRQDGLEFKEWLKLLLEKGKLIISSLSMSTQLATLPYFRQSKLIDCFGAWVFDEQ